jgi:hypothetical protein
MGTNVVSSIWTLEGPTSRDSGRPVPHCRDPVQPFAAASLELAWRFAGFAPWLVLMNGMGRLGDNTCLSCFKCLDGTYEKSLSALNVFFLLFMYLVQKSNSPNRTSSGEGCYFATCADLLPLSSSLP